MSDPTRRAWAYLSRVAEPPCAELAALVERVGPAEAAERVRRGQVDDAVARHTEARREIDRAADDLELLARRGGRLITPDDDEWRVLAFTAFDSAAAKGKPQGGPPMLLWALGRQRLDETAQRTPPSSEPGPKTAAVPLGHNFQRASSRTDDPAAAQLKHGRSPCRLSPVE
jgi:DNA processing protein